MHILLVEDDPAISRFVRRGLQEDQHIVDLAETGEDADELATHTHYDAIVLDVMLPGTDGITLCSRWRHRRIDTPILILTAREAVGDRVRALDSGADDYLTKPFAFDELLARLRALTRRGRSRHLAAELSSGSIAIHTDTHTVEVGGHPLDLSATEYRLLECLMRRAGTIVSRAQLAERVWSQDGEPASNVIDVYIGHLRRKLAAAGAEEVVIRTVRGLGYSLSTAADVPRP